MSSRKSTEQPPQPAPVAPAAPRVPAKASGRVQFDERGQAIWEWNVDTGRFERNASTARVRALTDAAGKLELEDTSAAGAAPAGAQPTDGTGGGSDSAHERSSPSCDPYSRGPSRSPESVTFNPHDRGVRPKR